MHTVNKEREHAVSPLYYSMYRQVYAYCSSHDWYVAVTCQINNVSSPDAMVDFTQSVFVANEGDGVIDICMVLVPPSGGMECDLTLELAVENGKAGRLTYATPVKAMKLT